MCIFEYAIANINRLNEPWGIKDIQSNHIFMNKAARKFTDTPSNFSVENKKDEEFPADWNELAEELIQHDQQTIKANQSVSVIEVHKWNGEDTQSPFISTKKPIYNLDGSCAGILWNAKPVSLTNPILKGITGKCRMVIISNIDEYMTRREQDVIFLIMNGYTRKETAKILNITTRTVERRLYNSMEKESFSNLSQLRDFYIDNTHLFKIPDSIIKKGIHFYE